MYQLFRTPKEIRKQPPKKEHVTVGEYFFNVLQVTDPDMELGKRMMIEARNQLDRKTGYDRRRNGSTPKLRPDAWEKILLKCKAET